MYRIKIKDIGQYITNVFDVNGQLITTADPNKSFEWENRDEASHWFSTLGGNDNQVDYESTENAENIE